MRLTEEEKGMLDGAEGPAVAAAMDLLVRYGEALGADAFYGRRGTHLLASSPPDGEGFQPICLAS